MSGRTRRQSRLLQAAVGEDGVETLIDFVHEPRVRTFHRPLLVGPLGQIGRLEVKEVGRAVELHLTPLCPPAQRAED